MTSSPTLTIPTNNLARSLAQITLHAVASSIEDFLARMTKAQASPRQIMEEIVRIESVHRTQRSLERRLQRARLGRFKPIVDFDWNWPEKIERHTIERALTLEFIREGRNLVVIGTNGLGKTMLSKNIAYLAVQAGHSVVFTTASELIDDLQGEMAHNTFRRKVIKYVSPHLLVVDEVGYLSYDSHAADLLYKIVDTRYERQRSILITTNLAFRDWNTV